MCDFCGSLTDIDFTVGMDRWNESAVDQVKYGLKKMMLAQGAQAALQRGDKAAYYANQMEYWDYYYRTFPAYLPPTVATPEVWAMYLAICAESSTEAAFEPKWQQYLLHQQQLQAAIQYYFDGRGQKAETTSFFALAEFFIKITKEGMRAFYENPQYAIMHELLPEPVHLKMRSSMFVQAWIPYLTEKDGDKFLRMLGFSTEYVDIDQPTGHYLECSSCKQKLFAPDGSYRVFCEQCRKVTPVKSAFFCMSCGAQNAVPADPSKPVDCQNCGIANRLVRPLFG
jgi:LSD1 subclass zinc finger protein